MEYVITFALLFVEMLAFYTLNDAFFTFIDKKRTLICYVVGSVINYIGLLIEFDGYIKAPFFFMMFFLLTCATIRKQVKQKLLITALFIALLYLVDLGIAFVFILLFGIDSHEMIARPYIFMSVTIISKFIVYLIVYTIRKLLAKDKLGVDISLKQWMQFLLFVFNSFIMIAFFMIDSFENNTVGTMLIVSVVSIILSNIAIFSLMHELEHEQKVKKEHELLLQQMEIETKNVENLSQEYALQRKLTHDFNNHILAIQGLLECEDISKAKEYIEEIAEGQIRTNLLVHSNHSIIDALLTQKYREAKKHNISMQVLVDDLSDVSMKAADLVVLLSNLLDNAIEACKQVEDKRIIKCSFLRDGEGYILTIHNTTKHEDVEVLGVLETTKKDAFMHGYGLHNIKAMIEQYQYQSAISCKDGWFLVTILMQRA
ncbi:MAG: GHKL domain-containing protein [Lachnospiraceae bacterium]